jgi:hypothetical protein
MDRTREHCELILAGMMLMIPQEYVAHVYAGMRDVQYDVEYYPNNLWPREQTWTFDMERKVQSARDGAVILQPIFVASEDHEAGDWDGEVVWGGGSPNEGQS